MENELVVYNPKSGNGINKNGIKLGELLEKSDLLNGVNKVVVFGGDGTACTVMRLLAQHHHSATVFLKGGGSLGHVAREFGFPQKDYTIQKMPLGTVEGISGEKRFVWSVGAGAGVALLQKIEKLRSKHGVWLRMLFAGLRYANELLLSQNLVQFSVKENEWRSARDVHVIKPPFKRMGLSQAPNADTGWIFWVPAQGLPLFRMEKWSSGKINLRPSSSVVQLDSEVMDCENGVTIEQNGGGEVSIASAN